MAPHRRSRRTRRRTRFPTRRAHRSHRQGRRKARFAGCDGNVAVRHARHRRLRMRVAPRKARHGVRRSRVGRDGLSRSCMQTAADATYNSLRQGWRRSSIASRIPRKWRFVEELPANDQGKSSAAMLLALFEPIRAPRLPLVTAIEWSQRHEATLTLFVPKRIVYFEGHFPGTPVLPGIAQLFWVAHFAKQLFGLEADWRQMEAIKFNRIVPPDTTVTLHLALRKTENDCSSATRSTALSAVRDASSNVASAFNPCLLIPVYNHGRGLRGDGRRTGVDPNRVHRGRRRLEPGMSQNHRRQRRASACVDRSVASAR